MGDTVVIKALFAALLVVAYTASASATPTHSDVRYQCELIQWCNLHIASILPGWALHLH